MPEIDSRRAWKSLVDEALVQLKEDTKDRDIQICAAYASGITLEQVGAEHGLTRERVRQIVGPATRSIKEAYALQRDTWNKQLEAHAAEILQLFFVDLKNIEEILEELHLQVGKTSLTDWIRAHSSYEERLARHRKGMGNHDHRKITKAELRKSLQQCAQEIGRTPSTAAYDKWIGVGRSQTIIKTFGSWQQACLQAGFNPHTRLDHPDWGKQKISQEDLVSAIQRVQAIVGHPPTMAEYKEHALSTDPKQITVRNRFGGWLAALEKCCN